MYKEAAVISALMKVYTIPCHDRGHINGMLVLQNCTDSLQVLPGSSSETFPTSSDGACNFSNTGVDEDVVVMEEGFVPINEEAAVRIQEEEVPEDVNLPDIKSEPNEVSYVCVCLLLDTLFQCSAVSVVFVKFGFLAKRSSSTVGNENVLRSLFYVWEWWWGLYWMVWSASNSREYENVFLSP
jgi:hypothetical protein